MSVRTRIATAADAERVVALYDEFTCYLRELGNTNADQLTRDTFLRDGFGPDPAFCGLVVEFDGKVIGYLLYYFGYDSELAARIMHIMDLYVSEGHRMHGAGASLMTRAQSICRDVEAAEMVWSVYKMNPKAREFYEHLGAELIDDVEYMYLKVAQHNDS